MGGHYHRHRGQGLQRRRGHKRLSAPGKKDRGQEMAEAYGDPAGIGYVETPHCRLQWPDHRGRPGDIPRLRHDDRCRLNPSGPAGCLFSGSCKTERG